MPAPAESCSILTNPQIRRASRRLSILCGGSGFRVCMAPGDCLLGVALAIRGICRTYGAGRDDMACTQPLRAGLRSSAPPAPHSELSITNSQRRVSHRESRATARRSQLGRVNSPIPHRPRPSQSAEGAPEASPARKGWERRPSEFRAPEVRHLRRGGIRMKVFRIFQRPVEPLKPRPTKILELSHRL